MGKIIDFIKYIHVAAGTGFAFFLFGIGGLCLNFSIIMLKIIPLPFSASKIRSEYFMQRTLHYAFRAFYWYLRVFRLIDSFSTGTEKIPTTAYIFIANHPTLLDIVLILATLPRATCVVKPEILSSIYMKGVAQTAGYVSNEDGEQLIESCIDKLKQGSPLVIFPEGTRSLPLELGKFKRSAAWISLRSGFPIIPSVITITDPILMKHWNWYDVPSHSTEMHLNIYDAVYPQDFIKNSGKNSASARKITENLRLFYINKVYHDKHKYGE